MLETGPTAAPGAPFLPTQDATLVAGAQFQESPRWNGLSKHLREHGKRRCPKCRRGRCKRAWMRATPLHRVRCPRTWIEVCPVRAKRFGLGCSVCRQFELAMPGLAESHQLGLLATTSSVNLPRPK